MSPLDAGAEGERLRAFQQTFADNVGHPALETAGSRLELGRALYHRALLHRARGDARRAKADLATACAILGAIGARRDLEGRRSDDAPIAARP